MGLERDEGGDVPVAAVTRLLDSEEHPDGIWMRADPVHLSADRDRLILLDSSVFNLTQHDALAVATEVQKVLDADAWRLEVPFRDRWYIRLPQTPDITTTDLAEVAGHDINPFLPAGGEATVWHRLLNEIQMQLHECDINRDREARGELPVNSLWFWGVGALPQIPPRRWSVVYSDDCFLRGLAMMSMTPAYEVPEGCDNVLANADGQADILVHPDHCRVASRYGDIQLWHDALQTLERQWFEPALKALQDNELGHMTIVSEHYEFSMNRFALRKFWRRPKAVTRFTVYSEQ